MLAFQFRQFISVPYFVQLMLVATLTTTLIQYLAQRAWGRVDPTAAWLRGGSIGMWTTVTAAAGIVGFERFKGTLVQLVIAPSGALKAVASVVSAAALFGLLAFPTAWLTWAVLNWDVTFTPWRRLLALVGAQLAFFVACLVVSYVVAGIFVLTPNAITYEGLLLIPVLIVSGIVFTDTTMPPWLAWLGKGLPLSSAYRMLVHGFSWSQACAWLLTSVAWLVLSWVLGRHCLRLACKAGTLEVV